MGVQSSTVSSLALASVKHYMMPELQRDLVWTIRRAVDLIDSVAKGYSIGTIHLWELSDDGPVVSRSVTGKVPAAGSQLVIDGQQRATALAALCHDGTPDWVLDADRARFDSMRARVCFNVVDGRIEEVVPKAQRPGSGWLRVHSICTATPSPDEAALQALVTAAAPPSADAPRFFMATILFRNQVMGHTIAVDSRQHTVPQAAEAFQRLNSKGTSLNQGDLVVASVASQCPNFVTDKLKPFVKKLSAAGLAAGNNAKIMDAVLRSLLTFVQLEENRAPAVRFSEIKLSELPLYRVDEFWPKVEAAWNKVLAYFADRGIDASALRSLNELAPLVLLAWMFPKEATAAQDTRLADIWVYMRRADRYTKQSTDAHALDARELRGCKTLEDAITALAKSTRESRISKFNSDVPMFSGEELLSRPAFGTQGRLDAYGTCYVLALGHMGRFDPLNGNTLSMTSSKARLAGAGKNCQWHHIIPKALVAKMTKVEPYWVNTMGNLALVSSETNNKWADAFPSVYLEDTPAAGQVPQGLDRAVSVSGLDDAERYVLARAELLAAMMNAVILRVHARTNPEPLLVGESDSVEDAAEYFGEEDIDDDVRDTELVPV